ncbi:MAG: trypsin-like peptidase domain-containing protein [Anaerolineaceae bacterium]|nr:trypsin-like peptidase domain-containing protein [Anaerolineaceae bacterium]
MKTKKYLYTLIPLLLFSMVLSNCRGVETLISQINNLNIIDTSASSNTNPISTPTDKSEISNEMDIFQEGFSDVYKNVLPSVVNIQVVQKITQQVPVGNNKFPFSLPDPNQNSNNGGEILQTALGSGFIWNKDGYIVTNNHVVENADQITVTFHDGTSVEGNIIGTDQESDLAVLKVEYPEEFLIPIEVADSTSIEVGQLVAAIGNPFGLQGTMTLGIISALGRSIPVSASSIQGSSYTIPDVIQTDAPINPGNSGGVLVNVHSQFIGVPTAIESSSGVNAGIGFAVPSVIVNKVIPALIKKGFYEHPWIGISGTTLNSRLAEAMHLPIDQKGALVVEVTPDSPADSAGVIGSDQITNIDNQELRIGGDIIIRVDEKPIKDFEDLTAYLARYTEAGQTISVTVLRDSKQEMLDIKLGSRPKQAPANVEIEQEKSGEVWLGIFGLTMNDKIAKEMDLPSDQTGVLIQQVVSESPADEAGLKGGYKSIIIGSEQFLMGGDIIISVEKQKIQDMQELQAEIGKFKINDQAAFSIIRDGEELVINVTLGERPETHLNN